LCAESFRSLLRFGDCCARGRAHSSDVVLIASNGPTCILGPNSLGTEREKRVTWRMKNLAIWKIFAALALIFSTPVIHAQSLQAADASFAWVNAMSGAAGNMPNFDFDTNGNCYAVCHFHSTNAVINGITLTNSGTGYDTVVIKYNSQGQVQWFKQATGSASDFGLAVAADPAGPIYVVGSFYSPVMTLGGLSVTNSTGTSSSDIFVAKFDTNGNVQWLRWGGSTGIDTCYHARVDHDGNVMILGTFVATSMKFDTTTLTATAGNNLFLIKLDPAGHVIWSRSAGGASGAAGYRMAVDSSNNYYLTGPFGGTVSFGSHSLVSAGLHDVFVAKYDTAGNVLWAISGGGSAQDETYGIGIDPAGNCYVAGYFASATATFGSYTLHTTGGDDMFLEKISPAGSVLWVRTGGSTSEDRGEPIAFDPQGNVYVGCRFSTNANFGGVNLTNVAGEDIAIAKYDPNGNLQWIIPAGGSTDDQPNHMAFDPSGHLFISGYCSSNCVFGNLVVSNTVTNGIYLARLDLLPTQQPGIINFSTTNIFGWLATAGGAVDAVPYHDASSITITSNAFSNGTFLQGGSLANFDGFWSAKYEFTLPYGATNVVLIYSNLLSDDRVVFELNGTAIGATGGQTTSGLTSGNMVFTEGGSSESYFFSGPNGTVSNTVTGGFIVPGTNVLLAIVNNTGNGVGGTMKTITASDGTTFGVKGVIQYSIVPPVLTGVISNADYLLAWPAGYTDFRLQTSTNIGDPSSWTDITTASNSLQTNITDNTRFFRLIKP
jgi:hypothetical protein